MLNLQTHFENVVQLWRERISCALPGCPGRRIWDRGLEGTGSIHVHGRRFCFPKCFEQEVKRRLREIWCRPKEEARLSRRVPLGLLLLSRGELTEQQLRHALESQQQNHGLRLGQWIAKLGYASQQQITAALGAQWSCPVLKSFPQDIGECAIPFRLLQRLRMAPVHFNPVTRVIHIAFAADIEYSALLGIEQILDCKAVACLGIANLIEGWLQSQEESAGAGDQVFENVPGIDEITRISSSYATKFCAEEIRIAGCGEYIWIRIMGGKDAANLLFRQSESPKQKLRRGSPQARPL